MTVLYKKYFFYPAFGRYWPLNICTFLSILKKLACCQFLRVVCPLMCCMVDHNFYQLWKSTICCDCNISCIAMQPFFNKINCIWFLPFFLCFIQNIWKYAKYRWRLGRPCWKYWFFEIIFYLPRGVSTYPPNFIKIW